MEERIAYLLNQLEKKDRRIAELENTVLIKSSFIDKLLIREANYKNAIHSVTR